MLFQKNIIKKCTTPAHAVVVRSTRTVAEEEAKDEGYGSIYRAEV